MLLAIENLSTTFHTEAGPLKVLDRVSLDIDNGETVALVGESGSGKSVTALSILRLLEQSSLVTNEGSIMFEGRDILTLDEPSMRSLRGNRIAMVFQEPMTSMNPVYSVGDQLIEPLILHQGLSRARAAEQAVELLRLTRINEPERYLTSYPHQLSGGQRQRVMIAMALACRPSLLIADEPTTALDVTIQAQILDLLQDIQREMNMAVLLITHDLAMVRKIADRVHIMQEGRIVEHGLTEEVFERPSHPYTLHLLGSVPKGEAGEKPASQPLIEVSRLRCTFPIKAGFFKRTVGAVKAVDDVTLTIHQGTTCGIVGESGSGKTTLGKCILRLIGCRGKISYNDRDLLRYSSSQLRPLRRELQIVFQDPFSSLSPRFTVEQIIGEGLKVHGIGKNRHERRLLVEEALAEVGLEAAMADRYPHEFSGGQRQRIAIARAVVLKPRFLVLDEPTSALDMTIQAQIVQLLRDLQARHQMTYLFITHDLRLIRALADEVAVMRDGKIVEAGPARRIFTDPQHPYTKTLFAAAFDLVSTGASSRKKPVTGTEKLFI